MNGITILSTIHTQTPDIKGGIIFTLIAASIFLAISFCSLIFEKDTSEVNIVVLIISLLTCIMLGIAVRLIDDEKYLYATIDPGTSINEVLDSYEIMDTDGDLYKLKIIEKEED